MKPIKYNKFNPNDWAVVTGASSGIGLSFSHTLAQIGYKLLLISNQKEDLERVAQGLSKEFNIEVKSIYTDLAAANAAEEVYKFIIDNNLNISILINNAGIFIFKDFINSTTSQIETIINLHTLTTTKLTNLIANKMKERGYGNIINTSSISALTPFPGISLYSATKSYIRTFTLAIHREFKEYGINIMALSPGAVATDLYNLPKNLQKLGVKIGVIYPPKKLTENAIRKVFKGKKEYIPGFINHLFSPIFKTLPNFAIKLIREKTKQFMR